MCGPSGSGKSTYIQENLKDINVVSTDTIRKELWGSEEDQRNPKEVFVIAYWRVANYLARGEDVVFDAMNLTRRDRIRLQQFISQYVKEDYKKVCIVMATSLKTCIARQTSRARSVSSEIVERQFNRMQYPFTDENWNEIRIIEEI